MKLKDFLVEAQATISDIATAVKAGKIGKMELELVKRKMFDRALTDYSTAWQRTYFSDSTNKKGGVYPNGKKRPSDRAEEDQNEIVKFYGKIGKKTKNLITDKAVLDYFAKEDNIDDLKAFLTGPFQDQLKQSGQLYPTNESIIIEGKKFYIYEKFNMEELSESLNITCSGNASWMAKFLAKVSKDSGTSLAIIDSGYTDNGESGSIVTDEKTLNKELVSIFTSGSKSLMTALRKLLPSSETMKDWPNLPSAVKKSEVEAAVAKDCSFAKAIMTASDSVFAMVGTDQFGHIPTVA